MNRREDHKYTEKVEIQRTVGIFSLHVSLTVILKTLSGAHRDIFYWSAKLHFNLSKLLFLTKSFRPYI